MIGIPTSAAYLKYIDRRNAVLGCVFLSISALALLAMAGTL